MIKGQIQLLVFVCLFAVACPAASVFAGTQGEPVAYVLLDPAYSGKNALSDLERGGENKAYIIGYKGVALMDKDTDNPVLVTRAYNLKLKKMVKLYLNWSKVIALQILDEKIAL